MSGLIKILNRRHILAGVFALWLLSFPSHASGEWVGWLAKITVSYGNDSNKVTLGAAANAVDGFESSYAGRAVLTGYLMAYFHHPEWGVDTDYFTRDMRSVNLPQEWTLYVSSSYTYQDIKMFWDTSRVPDTVTLVLEDVTTGAQVDMMATPSYTYYNTETNARPFRVIADGSFEVPPPPPPPPPGSDTTPPETAITTELPAFTGSSEVTIAYTGTDDVTPAGLLEFSYSVDGGGWSGWSTNTSATITGLSDGAHIFEVKSRDEAGNEDPSPAAVSFTVDTIPPALTLNEPNPSKLWPPNGEMVTVSFSGNVQDGTGLDTLSYTMIDEYGEYASSGTLSGGFPFELSLESDRNAR
jgi:hypothetical protein